jgi:hypothetical protein
MRTQTKNAKSAGPVLIAADTPIRVVVVYTQFPTICKAHTMTE